MFLVSACAPIKILKWPLLRFIHSEASYHTLLLLFFDLWYVYFILIEFKVFFCTYWWTDLHLPRFFLFRGMSILKTAKITLISKLNILISSSSLKTLHRNMCLLLIILYIFSSSKYPNNWGTRYNSCVGDLTRPWLGKKPIQDWKQFQKTKVPTFILRI